MNYKTNYDMNIFDLGMYLTAHEPPENQYSEWKVNFYEIHYKGDGIDTVWVEDHDFSLTNEEVKEMGLPYVIEYDPRNGELFYETEDMWIDIGHLEETFPKIPDRLIKHIENLPAYG
jgi:hypothetical protein